MPAARDCRQFHTVACVMGDPVPPTPLDDVYNRDALAGRACLQPLPSSLDVRRGDGTCPPYSDVVSVVPLPIPSRSSSDRVRGGRLPARPSISAVPGTALVAAFAVHNALKKTPTPTTDFFRQTPTDTDRPWKKWHRNNTIANYLINFSKLYI